MNKEQRAGRVKPAPEQRRTLLRKALALGGDAGAESGLAAKVKFGSQGGWGQIPMAPNGHVAERPCRGRRHPRHRKV